MDYKEKYEQALERCKEEFNFNNLAYSHEEIKQKLQRVFPELKESEDEKIRKEVIDFIRWATDRGSITSEQREKSNSWFAWLEKQGEQIDIANKEYWRGYREGKQEILDKYAEFEKQCEQKPANKCIGCNNFKGCITCTDGDQYAHIREQKPTDKVKPKFKVGDWVVSPNGVHWHIDSINNNRYEVSSTNGACADWPLDTDLYHLWTIQDAKAGDVLVASDGSIFLFAGVDDCACKYYVALTTDNIINFNRRLEHYWETSKGVHPATKEQRDLLFRKMKEAGYEWDAEKKELKKIEQKPVEWSEEDEKERKRVVGLLEGWLYTFKETCYAEDCKCGIAWLKSLKERMEV